MRAVQESPPDIDKQTSQNNEIGSHINQLIDPVNAWITEEDPTKATKLFCASIREVHQDGDYLNLKMNLHESLEERNRALVSFYKRPKTQWANPLRCKLVGDMAVGDGVTRYVLATVMDCIQNGFQLSSTGSKTLLFEGEKDHLVPASSQELIESDFFVVAGRMVGHCFLNEGPKLCGLSPAILHTLFGGDPETATVTMQDCVDLDVREVVNLLEQENDLDQDQKAKVLAVTLPWDLPGVTASNRWWLRDKILSHAVIGRTTEKVKQFRRGLKDTGTLNFFSSRPDAVTLLFPRTCETIITSQIILDRIRWPNDEDVDEDICTLEEQQRALLFLRQFIENNSSDVLKKLIVFWTGWDVVPGHLEVEVVDRVICLPQSSTCFYTLKLHKNISTFDEFQNKLMTSISTSYAGFGQY